MRLVDQLKTTALPEHTRRFTRTGQAGHPATDCRQVVRYSLIKSIDTFHKNRPMTQNPADLRH